MKRLAISLLLALVLVLSVGTVAMGADPVTQVDVNWSGTGSINGNSIVGSGWDGAGTSFAESAFNTGGSAIVGSYTVTTQGKTTYDVWGDLGPKTTVDFIASATGGGAKFQNNRTGATPYGLNQHYADAGQVVYAYADTGTGTGSVDFSLSSIAQYAGMANTSGGFNADASDYTLTNEVYSGTGNAAMFLAMGSGIANIDCWHTSAGNGVNFGLGQGCYTDADAAMTGPAGTFAVTGQGATSVVYPGMGMSSGGGTLGIVANWVNSLNVANFSLSAN